MSPPRAFGWLEEKPGEFDALEDRDGQRIGRNRDGAQDLAGAAPPPQESLTLVHSLPPFKDQGNEPLCVTHGLLNGAETRLRALGVAVPAGSVRAPYALSLALLRTFRGEPLVNLGTYPRVAFQCAKDWGVPPDSVWPFRDPRSGDVLDPIEEVPPHVLQAASAWKIEEQLTIYAEGDERVRVVATAVANLEPVPCAGRVDQAFVDYQGRGVLGAPDPSRDRGGHMVCIIGYRTNPRTKRLEFLIRNSWSAWGFVLQSQPALAWVSEEWVKAQADLFRIRVTKGPLS